MKYPYKVVYSRRRSILVSVSHDNEITVRCPFGTGRERIENFLDSKTGWLDKIISKNQDVTDENGDIISLKSVYLNGGRKNLVLGQKFRVDGENVYLPDIGRVGKCYVKYFKDAFIAEYGELCKRTCLTAKSVGFKNYRSRWGCCFGDDRIYFNYRIFMLPESVREYIIVHELCHLRYHNHSAAFWNLVSVFIPDCKERRKELKKFDFLTRLY